MAPMMYEFGWERSITFTSASVTGWGTPTLGSRRARRGHDKTRDEVNKIGREVDGMAVCGVGMTGKRIPRQDRAGDIIGVWPSLVPREKIIP
jgi:translation elongation factor EF-Tu-like GTPase